MRVGSKIIVRGQTYFCKAVEAYRNKRGELSPLYTLSSRCADCGERFAIQVSRLSLRRREFNRRCANCRKPGVKVVGPNEAAKGPDPLGSH